MVSEHQSKPELENADGPGSVDMPRPTIAPLVLAMGLTLLAAGVPLGPVFVLVGAAVVITGAGMWVVQLLPGRGHIREPLVAPEDRPRPVTEAAVGVQHLWEGMPGYRLRLPQAVHPVSAGIKGGLVGALVMPIPALVWGLLTGHGIWYPVNLLAGMVLPRVEEMSVPELEQFHLSLLAVGVVIHAVMSLVMGLIYGVLLPTLPPIARPITWGGLLAPLLWTGTSYILLGVVNPALAQGLSWPWFIVSQFFFGIAAAAVILATEKLPRIWSGLLAGVAGGILMSVPALLWSLLTRHGLWYPVNLLAAMVLREMGRNPAALEQFHTTWFVAALSVHALLSASFGILLAWIQRKLPTIPGPVAWGGFVPPLLWTGISYSLMGVLNPALQSRVDWAWFVVSQFVFGVTTAVVVLRSEKVYLPPAGGGREDVSNRMTEDGGGRS